MIRRLALLPAVLALVVACSSGASGPAETVPADAFVVTAIPGLRFGEDTYTVDAGEITFAFVNEDSMRHTMLLAKDDVKVPNFRLLVNRKDDVDSGTVTLEPGTYLIFCDVPGHGNMKATLIVE
jgi:plastocyanin